MADLSVDQEVRSNLLLSALPEGVRERIFPILTAVELPLGKVLWEPGQVRQDVYFPIDSIVVLLSVMECGATAEISLIGNEGLIGLPAVTNGGKSQSRAIVQAAGIAYHMPAARLRQAVEEDPEVRALLLGAMQSTMTEISQTVACNRFHTIEQQFCRWLLLCLDRLPDNHLDITQELIAEILGVRRESISEAAGKLQSLGIIHYRRGHIAVLDRPKLEELSCECYAAVKRESSSLHAV